MGDYSNSSYSAPFSEPTEICASCGNKCSEHCEIDRGDGFWTSFAVCDTDCANDLQEKQSGFGQTRMRFPV